MRRAVLLLALELLACAPDRRTSTATDRITVEPLWSFTPTQQEEIERAAAEWNARTVPSKRIVFERGGDWRVLGHNPCTGVNGHADPVMQVVHVTPDPGGGATVYAVALHEFGHVLGMWQHTPTGVMHASEVSVEFTAEVMAECRRVGACR
jgi:hypothetical protein